jgi:hypothetical protein
MAHYYVKKHVMEMMRAAPIWLVLSSWALLISLMSGGCNPVAERESPDFEELAHLSYLRDIRQVFRRIGYRVDDPSSRISSIFEVTRGEVKELELNTFKVETAVFRAYIRQSMGTTAGILFVHLGPTAEEVRLASGSAVRQIGLKLLGANSCNSLYIMWRVDETGPLTVQLKHNPGKRWHVQCGAAGYSPLQATSSVQVPAAALGKIHTLTASIQGETLVAAVDGLTVWVGALPPIDFKGPAGLRSDNAIFQFSLLD